MIIIGRPIEGIYLNGLEYLLEDDGSKEKEFESKKEAIEFLREAGETLSDEDLELAYVFIDTETNEEAV
jgi:hypothetical protein